MSEEFEFLREVFDELKSQLDSLGDWYQFEGYSFEVEQGLRPQDTKLHVKSITSPGNIFFVGFDTELECWTRSFSDEVSDRLPVRATAAYLPWMMDSITSRIYRRVDYVLADLQGEQKIRNAESGIKVEFNLWAFPVKVLLDLVQGNLESLLDALGEEAKEPVRELAGTMLQIRAGELQALQSSGVGDFLDGASLRTMEFLDEKLAEFTVEEPIEDNPWKAGEAAGRRTAEALVRAFLRGR